MSLRTGKLRVARTYFHRVQRVDPENWLVDYYLGLLAMRERRYPQGRDHFKSYLSHQGDVGGQAWAHYRLGDCYWYLHEDALAQKAWRESAKMNSSLKGPQRRLAGKTPRRASSADAYSRPPTGGSKGKSGKAKSPSAQGGGAAAAKARYEARKAAEAAAAGGVPVPDVTPGAAGEPLPAEDAAAKEAAEADGAAVPGH